MDFSQIIDFLFGREPLSLVFISLMLALFVFGAWFARRKMRTFQEQLQTLSDAYKQGVDGVSQKINPKEYIELNLDERHTSSFIETIPGVLVSLGILGTFIGLGVAIHEASGTMGGQFESVESMKQLQQSLNSLLTAVAAKFQVSAWGIILSITFTFSVQRRFEEALENSIEQSSQQLLGYYVSVADAISQTAQLESLNLQEGIVVGLQKGLESISRELSKQFEQQQVQTSHFFREVVDGLQASVNKQEVILQSIHASQQEGATQLKKLGNKITKIHEASQQIEKSNIAFIQHMEKITTNNVTQQQTHQQTIEKQNLTLQQQIEKLIAGLNAYQTQQMTQSQQFINSIQTEITTLGEQQVETHNQHLQQIGEMKDGMLKHLQAEQLQARLRYEQHSKNLIDRMTDVSTQTKASFENIQVNIAHARQESNSVFAKQMDSLQKLSTTLTTLLDQANRQFLSSVEMQKQYAEAQATQITHHIAQTLAQTKDSRERSEQLQQELNEMVALTQSLQLQSTKATESSNLHTQEIIQLFHRFEKLFTEKTLEIGLYDPDLDMEQWSAKEPNDDKFSF